MPDMGAISAAANSVNVALNIVKALLDIHDARIAESKLLDLQRALRVAHQEITKADQENAALRQRIVELERALADAEKWNEDKIHYERVEAAPGIVAYALKPQYRGIEAPYYLCAQCFQNGKPSPLAIERTPGGIDIVTCRRAECKSRLIARNVRPAW